MVNFGMVNSPPICNLKKYGWLGKNSADIRISRLSRKLKNRLKDSADYKNFAVKIQPITNYKQFQLSC